MRVHSQQRGQQRVVRWPARAGKERATARAGSRQHRGEKERGSQCKKKSLGKKLEETNKIDLNKI
jgi:hypothetical protein